MNDLISRNALLQQLRTDKALGFDDFYETVENFPTAYDVNKVLEQLETDLETNTYYSKIYDMGIKDAILIVKGAVKDE